MPVAPTAFYAIEISLLLLVREFGRLILQASVQTLEPSNSANNHQDVYFQCVGYREMLREGQASVLETVGQLGRKAFISNPNRRKRCPHASSNLRGWDFMNSRVNEPKMFIGVDVSKATLDVFRPYPSEAMQIENSDEAIANFCAQLQKKKRQVMVVMEGAGLDAKTGPH